jgi:hypothetical protein
MIVVTNWFLPKNYHLKIRPTQGEAIEYVVAYNDKTFWVDHSQLVGRNYIERMPKEDHARFIGDLIRFLFQGVQNKVDEHYAIGKFGRQNSEGKTRNECIF